VNYFYEFFGPYVNHPDSVFEDVLGAIVKWKRT